MTDRQRIEAPSLEGILRLSLQQQGNLILKIDQLFGSQSARVSALAITYSSAGGTRISSSGGGYLVSIAVTQASAASTTYGYIYDANNSANVSSTNLMAVVSGSVGLVTYNLPYFNGLVVQMSSTGASTSAFHTASVFYT